MLKRVSCLILCLAIFFCLPVRASAEEASETPAYEVYADDTLVVNAGAAIYDSSIYVSLFYVTSVLCPGASASWEGDCMVVSTDTTTLVARPKTCCLISNGRYLYIPGNVKQAEDGDVLVPAEVLARALGASVTWDETAVFFTSGGEPLESGDTFYDPEAVDLLARVIRNESGNQSLSGQIAVGNVILNRVASSTFPNTLSEVIFQPGQFPGTTEIAADTDSIIAAKLCLDGAQLLPDAYWFSAAGHACWASRNKALVATIGGHAFYG